MSAQQFWPFLAPVTMCALYRSYNGRKTRSERCETPVVEIRDRNTWHVHQDVAASVDKILNGEAPATHTVDIMQHE